MILMLDLKGRIIKEKMLYKGTTDSFSVNTKQLVRELILAKAKKFYLIHNHPDENSEASEDDIVTTKVIEKAAKNMNVKLLDHLIIYKGGFSCVKGR